MEIIGLIVLLFVAGFAFKYYQRRKQYDLNDYLTVDNSSQHHRKKTWFQRLPFMRKKSLLSMESRSEPGLNTPLDLVVLSVIPKPGHQFASYDLFQAISNAKFHFGDMNIFHRHETASGEGEILFGLVSINKPGTFDLNNIGIYACPGLTLFADMNGQEDPIHTFDIMLAAAYQLAEELNGTIMKGQTEQWTEYSADAMRDDLSRGVYDGRYSVA